MCELFAVCSSKPASVTYSLREFALHGGAVSYTHLTLPTILLV